MSLYIFKLMMECTLQWLLANNGSFSAKDTYSRLVDPTAIYQNGMFIVELKCYVLSILFKIYIVIPLFLFLMKCLLDFSILKSPYRQRRKQLVSWKFIKTKELSSLWCSALWINIWSLLGINSSNFGCS